MSSQSLVNDMMEETLRQISSEPLIVKKTNYVYPDNFHFSRIERVHDFYIENNRKFTWLKQWRGNIFIHGTPFSSYNFM
uniref:Uncharacterized protein n=1 Tax=viral metagenome TaxID=1070528 RepID=A0A6C0KZ30_9ZZZZ